MYYTTFREGSFNKYVDRILSYLTTHLPLVDICLTTYPMSMTTPNRGDQYIYKHFNAIIFVHINIQ